MNRLSLCAVSLAVLAVAGCASDNVMLGGNQPQAPVTVPQTGAVAGEVTQQASLGRVSGPCTAPRQSTLTVRRNQVVNDGSLQVRFNGRDPSYRTTPFVYMFQTNAQLVSVSGAQLQTEVFGLWQGQIWSADICGRRIRIGLQRVTDQAATISIR